MSILMYGTAKSKRTHTHTLMRAHIVPRLQLSSVRPHAADHCAYDPTDTHTLARRTIEIRWITCVGFRRFNTLAAESFKQAMHVNFS